MARKIEALVLRNINCVTDGIVRKGDIAHLTGKEMEHYLSVGAVQRPEFNAAEFDDDDDDDLTIDDNSQVEGGDA